MRCYAQRNDCSPSFPCDKATTFTVNTLTTTYAPFHASRVTFVHPGSSETMLQTAPRYQSEGVLKTNGNKDVLALHEHDDTPSHCTPLPRDSRMKEATMPRAANTRHAQGESRVTPPLQPLSHISPGKLLLQMAHRRRIFCKPSVYCLRCCTHKIDHSARYAKRLLRLDCAATCFTDHRTAPADISGYSASTFNDMA